MLIHGLTILLNQNKKTEKFVKFSWAFRNFDQKSRKMLRTLTVNKVRLVTCGWRRASAGPNCLAKDWPCRVASCRAIAIGLHSKFDGHNEPNWIKTVSLFSCENGTNYSRRMVPWYFYFEKNTRKYEQVWNLGLIMVGWRHYKRDRRVEE